METIHGLLRAPVRPLPLRQWLKCVAACFAACCICAGAAALDAQAANAAENAPAKEQSAPEQDAHGEKAAAPHDAVAAPAATPEPAPAEVRELWTGSLYSSTYRVGVCFSAQGKVRGVVHLRLYNGKVDVYHIDGTVRDNEIEAHHSSGHTFKGRLASADKVEGVISLKNGMNVRLEGKRTHDVQLAPEDCAPLPQ